jgi:hypothetical protein
VGTPPERERERDRDREVRERKKAWITPSFKGAEGLPKGELHDLLKGNSIMHCLLKGNSIMTEEEERDPGELLHNILPIFLSTNAFSDTKQFLLNTRNPNSNKNLSQESKPTHTGYRYPSRPVSE